jgi:DNA transposition AAA+ family ATPase
VPPIEDDWAIFDAYARVDSPWLFRKTDQPIDDLERTLTKLALDPSDKQRRIALAAIARQATGIDRALACARITVSISNRTISNNLKLLPRHLRGLNWKT